MINGKTTTGFKFSVDANTVKDMEFIEIVAEASENPLAITKLLNALLGVEQKKALYAHVRERTGHALVDDVEKEVAEILEAVNTNDETKN